jgi:gamma-glutamyltranspeptidase/glutathione hydrolase
MYQDSLGNIIEGSSRMGHLAVGVPGTVDGMVKAFEKYSKLKDWSALVQPAIDLANNGFPLTKAQALNLNAEQDIFRKYNEESCAFIVKDRFKTNNILVQKALGETLERIRDQGRAGFYSGKTAELLLAEMNEHQALISQHDLVTYSSIWRKPIISTYKNYKIIGMPPPSSGGIILAQMLGMVEHFPLNTMGFQSAASVHLMVEAERRAYADRATHLGDADFYQVPVESLLDSIYILARMEDLDLNKAGKSNDVLAGFIKQSEETTHFSIIDQWGNAVSLTTTLNDGFGSRIVVDGAGFLLNNEMDDFSIKPGVPNLYGLIGAEANKVEGGKRMLSSMTPTIVEKDDHLFMIVGTPGGSTIITSVFQVFLNITEFGLSAYEAVASPRFHHQWLPDQIYVEKDCLDNETKATLMAMGHKIKTRSNIGRVELILIEQNGKIHAVADPRGDDHVSGY